MSPHLPTLVGVIALLSASCGDGQGGSGAARQRALVEKSCAHTAMCRPDAYAEDFADNDACIAAYSEELAGVRADVTTACFEAYLDYGECTIEDCETEDLDCGEQDDKLEAACN